MKMITLFLPEKYLEMLDTLVAENLYPNRSEAIRIATFKFLHESVDMLKAIPARSTPSEGAKKNNAIPIDEIIQDLGTSPGMAKSIKSNANVEEKTDPFDELVGSIQAV
ncbi:MAG TPA: ribbon-helix-helix domain-containing protein [Candidatus Lokiarchaeia archaeon]|nr:ribbon-helix-helix domain-containing protein [Candidatus Lokiarchaeia archaeon]